LRLAFAGESARRHALVGPWHLWEMKRSFQLKFLRAHGLEPHHRIVDIGCGTLRGGIPIIEYLEAGLYTGIDARPQAIEEAREELRECGLENKRANLIATPALASVELEGHADVVWAFSVLFHMDDDALEKCFAFVGKSTDARAVLYANVVLGTKQRTGTWEGFPVVTRPFDEYVGVADRYGFEAADMGTLKELGHVSGENKGDLQHMIAFRRR